MKRLVFVVLLAASCRRPVPFAPLGEPPAPAAPPATTARPALRAPVGVTSRSFTRDERTLDTTIWYPAAADAVEEPITWDGIFPASVARDTPLRPEPRRFPVVLLSHGSGGDGSNLTWLADALVSHGYVVAAVDHPGDRFGDTSLDGRLAIWRRARDLSAVLSGLFADPTFGPRLDRRRVAAAGHSSGGATVLALAGARIQPAAYLAYCHGRDPGPDCALVAGATLEGIPDLAAARTSPRDRRVRAILALAPVMGRGASAASLRRIAVPVRVVASPEDELVPFRWNAARYARLIPRARLTRIPHVGHLVFMPVCNEPGRLLASDVCVDRDPDVDRAGIHAQVKQLALAFFDQVLGVRPAGAHPPQVKRARASSF